MKQKLATSQVSADEESTTSEVLSIVSSQSKAKEKLKDNSGLDEDDEEEQASTVSTSKGGATSNIQWQLLSFLNRHKETKLQARQEIFVKFIKTSIEDLEDEVYLNLEFEMYQLIHRHQPRDKQLKRSKILQPHSFPPHQSGTSTSAQQKSGQQHLDNQWQPMPNKWPQQTFPSVSPWQSQAPSFMTQLQQSPQQFLQPLQHYSKQPPQQFSQQPSQRISQQYYQTQPTLQTTPSSSGPPSAPIFDLNASTPSFILSSIIESTPRTESRQSDNCTDSPATTSRPPFSLDDHSVI